MSGGSPNRGSPEFGSTAFGGSSNPAFDVISTPAFGSSIFGASTTGSAFGSSSMPAFSATAPAVRASRTSGFNFSSSPTFGQSSSKFGSTPFGSTNTAFGAQNSLFRTGGANYTQTTETETDGQPPGNLESISAMPAYKDKSHEELRWKDYQLGDKSGGFCITRNDFSSPFLSASMSTFPNSSLFGLGTSSSSATSLFSWLRTQPPSGNLFGQKNNPTFSSSGTSASGFFSITPSISSASTINEIRWVVTRNKNKFWMLEYFIIFVLLVFFSILVRHNINMRTCTAYVVMVLVNVAYGGSNILVKIAIDKGLNLLAFMVYRHLIALSLLGPLAFVLERKQRPALSLSMTAKIFVLASLGTTIHSNVYYIGLAYTSATVASALSNVIPSLTFLMALLLGMEKVDIRSSKGQAKVLGTAICICGSIVFTFWKGGYLFKSFEDRSIINWHGRNANENGNENWVKGSILILTSHVAWSSFLILQGALCKVYPAPLSLNALICLFASIQSSILGIFFERNAASWKLEWNEQLLAIVYCGVAISALVYFLITWCVSVKGPVFTAMFTPLLLVVVGLFSAAAFAERLHLSSLIGALVIVTGLYCVLWGKAEDDWLRQNEAKASSLVCDEA